MASTTCNQGDIHPAAVSCLPAVTERSFGGRFMRVAPWIIIVLGVALRLVQYAHDRSLFLDEAFVALSIAQKSFSELLHPILFDQRAPGGFLLAVKAIYEAFGDSDLMLRLVPLVAGVAAVAFFYWMARGFVGQAAALLASLFFALSDNQIFYSSELKSYSLDALTAICLLWAFAAADRQPLNAWRAIGLGLLGAASVWCSFPAAFVMAGLGTCAGIRELAKRRWSQAAWLVLVGAVWAVGFGTVYFLQLRHYEPNPGLQGLWEGEFMPTPLWRFTWVKWLFERLQQLTAPGAGLEFAGLGLLMLFVGIWSLWRENRYKLFLLISPLFVALCVSALKIYPLGPRLSLYLAPTVIVLIVEGIDCLRRNLPERSRAIAIGAAALLLVFPIKHAVDGLEGKPYLNRMFGDVYRLEETKPLMAHIRKHWQPGDLVYLYSQSYVAFEYYADRFGFQSGDWVRGLELGMMNPKWSEIQEDIAKHCQGHRRVWFLFTHVTNSCGADDRRLFRYFLDPMGSKLDEFNMPGNCDATVYLYNLSEPKASSVAQNTDVSTGGPQPAAIR